ncbi:MAG: hypothetical protein WCQ76_05125 [Fusobacterium sp.]
MGVLTKYFGFLKAETNENVDVEKHINDTFDSIDNLLKEQSDKIESVLTGEDVSKIIEIERTKK